MMIKALWGLMAQWQRQRRRRTELVLAELPPALRRDVGFPAVDLFLDAKTRFLRN